jgi:hypothetical protein
LTAEDGYQPQRSYSIASAPKAPPDLERVRRQKGKSRKRPDREQA